MPYRSPEQANLMRAVAHSPSFAKKVGIPQSVGKKFEAHKAEGGAVKESTMKKIFAGKESKAEEAKEKVAAKKAGVSYKAAEKKFEGAKFPGKYAKGGGIESKGKTKGKMVKMAMGGFAAVMPETQSAMQAAAKPQMSTQPADKPQMSTQPADKPQMSTQPETQPSGQQLRAAYQKQNPAKVTTGYLGNAKEQADQKMREDMSGQKIGNAQSALDNAQKLEMERQAAAQSKMSRGPINPSEAVQARSFAARQQMAGKSPITPVVNKYAARRAVEEQRNRMQREEGFASGGSVSSRGDGCAQRGKTKGRYI